MVVSVVMVLGGLLLCGGRVRAEPRRFDENMALVDIEDRTLRFRVPPWRLDPSCHDAAFALRGPTSDESLKLTWTPDLPAAIPDVMETYGALVVRTMPDAKAQGSEHPSVGDGPARTLYFSLMADRVAMAMTELACDGRVARITTTAATSVEKLQTLQRRILASVVCVPTVSVEAPVDFRMMDDDEGNPLFVGNGEAYGFRRRRARVRSASAVMQDPAARQQLLREAASFVRATLVGKPALLVRETASGPRYFARQDSRYHGQREAITIMLLDCDAPLSFLGLHQGAAGSPDRAIELLSTATCPKRVGRN